MCGRCGLHPLFLWGNLIVSVQATDADLRAFWIARSNACSTTVQLHLHTKIVLMLLQGMLSRPSNFLHPRQHRSHCMYRLSSIPAALLTAAISSTVSPPCPLITLFFPGLDPREPCLRVALPRVMILDKSLVMPYHPECIKITSIQIVINKHCCIHHHLNNTLIGCAFAARFVYIRSPHYTYATDPK